MAEQFFDAAQRQQDQFSVLAGHRMLGVMAMFAGEPSKALHRLKLATARYDLEQHRSLAFRYGDQEPTSIALAWSALALYLLGYPDQAAKNADEAVSLASDVSCPFNLAYVLCVASLSDCWLLRSVESAQSRVSKAVAVFGGTELCILAGHRQIDM